MIKSITIPNGREKNLNANTSHNGVYTQINNQIDLTLEILTDNG